MFVLVGLFIGLENVVFVIWDVVKVSVSVFFIVFVLFSFGIDIMVD